MEEIEAGTRVVGAIVPVVRWGARLDDEAVIDRVGELNEVADEADDKVDGDVDAGDD